MGTPYSPASLTQLYPLLEKAFPNSARLPNGGIRSGIIANKPGYHNSRNRLLAQGRKSDYSVVEKRDKAGSGDTSRGFDCRMTTADLNTVCRRLMAASLARDPRLVKYVREWFGSYTGHSVVGYSLFRRRPATSDPSHEWHFHLSLWTDTVTNRTAMLSVLEVILGYPAGHLTDPAPTKPKPPSTSTPSAPKAKASLAELVKAAHLDPPREQGGTTPGAEDSVRLVEAALVAEGLLLAQYGSDGAFGSSTVEAYAAWQRKLGYSGADADGIPGKTSLEKLAKAYGFTAVA